MAASAELIAPEAASEATRPGAGSLPGTAKPEQKQLADFHEELRRKNLSIITWSAAIFNVAYVAWTGFDYLLARDHWEYFLALRLVTFAINTAIVVAVRTAPLRRFTFEAFWLWVFLFGAFIAPMLPVVGSSATPYTLGFTLVLYGGGLLPWWPPRFAASCVAAVVASVPLAFLIWPSSVATQDLVAGAFFILTGAAFSLVMASFKYNLARRDFFTRSELETAVQRETDANRRLALASADLQKALEKLKEHDRLKSKFFANISHELRTPLTLILAPVDELLRSLASESERRQLSGVRSNAERLLRLIDDLLELSRLDAGGLRLNLADVDVRAILSSVQQNSEPAAMARSIKLRVEADATTQKIVGDAHRLEIVLTNLVGNALKYTADGGHVDVRIADQRDGVRVEVSDSGEGIPEEDLPHVFERFFQVQRDDRRRTGGVGIGLALAKELVELHGGTIGVSSRLGVGTSFTVFLPFGRAHIRPDVVERRRQFRPVGYARRAEDPRAGPASDPRPAPPGAQEQEPAVLFGERRARILLVEDHEELREFIRALLAPGHDVITARDGDEGWELVNRERPDLVVSDVMMPGRSGTHLCRDIKSSAALRATPVILLTARVGSEATLEGYAHGADEFVAKPFHPRVLLARVRAQLRLRAMALQLAEREKLAVVGTLAAGILHEVRNPVNAILNGARVLASAEPSAATASSLLAVIEQAATRIQHITVALESHARPAEAGDDAFLDAREGLDATLELLGHRLERVSVHRSYGERLEAIVPASALNQVFLNVLDNALNAGAKTLWVAARREGDRVEVRLGNDGPAIAPDVASKIFDPFFTTAEPGQGTGLGLYLSKRIVQEHGGRIWLEARPAGGPEFVISLPAQPSPQPRTENRG